MSRRSSPLENRGSVLFWNKPKHSGGNVFEKRQSSAELTMQKMKQKFRPISRQASSPNVVAVHSIGRQQCGDQGKLVNHERASAAPWHWAVGQRQPCVDHYRLNGVIDHSRFDEEHALKIQKEIFRAKSEAKTVSVIDGSLYINYQYVGPLPPGCVV